MNGINIEPITGKLFGATVSGIKLAELDSEQFAEVHRAFLEFGFLIFPDQHLSEQENIEFGERFGALEFGALPMSNTEQLEDGRAG